MWLFFLHGVAVLSIIFILVLNDCLFVCLFFFGCVFISFLIFTISIPSSQSILVCIVYIHHVEYYFLLIINWYECQHTRTYARTHTRTHARTHTHVHARTHACTHTHTYVYKTIYVSQLKLHKLKKIKLFITERTTISWKYYI